jgi:hypothetical protein
VNLVRPCVLCRPKDGRSPYAAAPGWYACHHCADRLAGILGDLADRYATLQEADELIPHGSGERGSPGFGPRSPAVDALLVHSDVRTKWSSEHGHGALAAVESWARMIREETRAGVPEGRATMARELRTIRWNWDFLMSAAWLDEFAEEIRDALFSLMRAGKLTERVMRVGPCPVMLPNILPPDGILAAIFNGKPLPGQCGHMLTVRADADEIKCRSCGSVWPRSRWHELGDQWIDYAALSEELGVSNGTLRRWCGEDEWTRAERPGRPLFSRLDAHASYERRRGPVPLLRAG